MDYRNSHKHSFGGIKRHSIHKRRANNLSITDQTQAEWIKKQLKTKVTHCSFMKACRNFNLPESVSICPYLAPYWFLSLAPWRHIWGFHLQKWILINEKENDEKKKKSIIFQDHQVWKCWADKEKQITRRCQYCRTITDNRSKNSYQRKSLLTKS